MFIVQSYTRAIPAGEYREAKEAADVLRATANEIERSGRKTNVRVTVKHEPLGRKRRGKPKGKGA